jgi:hypothetical protein
LYSEGRDVDLIFRGDNSDTGIIKNTQIFSQDVDIRPFAYQLLRRPAKELDAGGRDIPGLPIQAGAADDIDAVIHKDLEVDCVSIRHRVLHLQLLGIRPGIFILLPGIRALYHQLSPLAILSEPVSGPKSRAYQTESLPGDLSHSETISRALPCLAAFHRQVWFHLLASNPPFKQATLCAYHGGYED